jgi:hypothetical protein
MGYGEKQARRVAKIPRQQLGLRCGISERARSCLYAGARPSHRRTPHAAMRICDGRASPFVCIHRAVARSWDLCVNRRCEECSKTYG